MTPDVLDVPLKEVLDVMSRLNLQRVEAVNPSFGIETAEGEIMDAERAQRVAPAIGSAAGGR